MSPCNVSTNTPVHICTGLSRQRNKKCAEKMQKTLKSLFREVLYLKFECLAGRCQEKMRTLGLAPQHISERGKKHIKRCIIDDTQTK